MMELESSTKKVLSDAQPGHEGRLALNRGDVCILASFALVKIVVHLLTNGHYGYFRDEFYYLDCAEHLAWGYVDHPPLSIAVLALTKGLLGTSITALRLPVVLAGAGTVVLSGLIARAMGGGRFAMVLACLSVLIAGIHLAIGTFFSMNALDQFFWALCGYLLVRIVVTGNPRLWLWFGVVAGFGLLNKISVMFLGFGVVVALILTPHRKHFGSRYLWLGGLLALLIFLPHILWQIEHGFPTLEFIQSKTTQQIVHKSPVAFFLGQVLELHPANAPIWLGGILFGFFGREEKRFRIFSIVYVVIFILFVLTNAKVYYLSPIYPMVLALGAIGIERVTRERRRLRAGLVAVLAVLGVCLAPMAIPLLSADGYIRYERAIGLSPPVEEHSHSGAPLPQHFGDRFGWEEMVVMVAKAYNGLSEQDRARCAIMANNYGEAGAINFFGRDLGLPRAICSHLNHYLWGPGDATGEVMLVYTHAVNREWLEGLFEEVTEIARFRHPYVMRFQNDRPLYLCRGLRLPMRELWLSLKGSN